MVICEVGGGVVIENEESTPNSNPQSRCRAPVKNRPNPTIQLTIWKFITAWPRSVTVAEYQYSNPLRKAYRIYGRPRKEPMRFSGSMRSQKILKVAKMGTASNVPGTPQR